MKFNVPLDLAEVFGGADDAEVSNDVSDPFQKFMETAEIAGALGMGASSRQTANNSQIEAAEIDARFAARYHKIAADAARKTPPGDPQKLAKRFSQPDPKAAYRKYFEEEIAGGKTASQILAAWLEEFEHRNPNVEKMMRETCLEFA
jgi:hypothetical protein